MMPDMEKVVKGLTELKKYLPSTMWEPINNALALLKEQPKIVRCRDCKYKEEHPSPYWKYWCNRLKCGCDDVWFCADGEGENE